ncbi:tolB protein precursor [Vulgatibacter incomptus]|uniref:TolB protein n=1 Tax=Vulgatibacter incomptus TaxID=1391653 RepID=A0A0K1PCT7_9BACT|nr:tolB protein precursor [Vulgatibacter incomptus]
MRWYGFKFKEVLLPQLPGAGVRLFYYQSETKAAEVAAGVIREQYMQLARAFDYVPEREVPYVLYATHLEFQATNLFPISEGVLGVTSPSELTLTLPFFGDLEQYRHTSTHELTHEFTIQIVRSAGEAAGRPGGLGGFPLWFIEGLAEYAAYGGMDPDGKPGPEPRGASGPSLPGLDPDTEAWARDLLYRSSPFEGYLIPPFYSDYPMGYVHTYKLGQLRVAFMGATFGRELIIWLLKNASTMGLADERGAGVKFPELVKMGTGYDKETIERLFADWIQRRYLPAYDQARTRVPSLQPIDNVPVEAELVVASPDGKTLLMRGFDRELGEGSLWLLEGDNPGKSQLVVRDSRPGLESLHLISRRTFALGNERIAWIGRAGEADVLTVARLEKPPEGSSDLFRITDRRSFELVKHHILEGGDPTFSPDERRIAFSGVDTNGFKDVYIMDVDEGFSSLRRVTQGPFSKSGLSWTADGIYLATDAAPDGDANIGLLDPETGAIRVVVADRSIKECPVLTPAGLVYASNLGGRWDLYRIEDGVAWRITDVSTLIRSPAVGAKGSLYGIIVHGGHFRLARLPPVEILRLDGRPPIAADYDPTPRPLPILRLPEVAPEYRPFDHFGIDMGGIQVGTQTVAVGGISFSDLLRDRLLAVQLAVYGSLDFTDASAIFLDRSQRTTWLAGIFHTFQPKRDRTFGTPALPDNPDFFLEREFGAMGGLSYPFNRFERMDVLLTVEGVHRSRFTDRRGTRDAAWEELTGGNDLQLLATAGYGLDTLRYHPFVGPISGSTVLFAAGTSILPQRLNVGGAGVNGWAEFDLQHFFYLGARSTFWTRAAAGSAFGGRFSRQFYLSSVDNLRGYHWSDDRLLGTHYYVANAELSFPLDWLIRIAIFEGLRGVGAVDFGGVTDHYEQLLDARSLDLAVGLDFLAGPLAMRLHFGYPIQIGPVLPADGWVTNFALRLRY